MNLQCHYTLKTAQRTQVPVIAQFELIPFRVVDGLHISSHTLLAVLVPFRESTAVLLRRDDPCLAGDHKGQGTNLLDLTLTPNP